MTRLTRNLSFVEYNYDAASNRTQLKLDGTVHTTYNYDAANRLTQLTDEASQNFTFGYDNANRLTSRNLPNGVTTTMKMSMPIDSIYFHPNLRHADTVIG